MVIDRKIESGFPLPTKVMCLIPLGLGGLMIYSGLLELIVIGVLLVLLCVSFPS